MQNEDWDLFRYVLALAECGTASAAAAQLRVNHTTVLRRITHYENRVGFKLFSRSRAGYAPTIEGEAIVTAARQMAERLDGLHRDLLGGEDNLQGTLSVTTTDTFAALVLPHLKAFRDAHPSILVDLTITNARLNLFDRDADIGIRPAQLCPPNLVGQRVGTLGFALYTASQGPDPGIIAVGEGMTNAPSAETLADMEGREITMRCNSFPVMREAVAAGLGTALLPCNLGDSDVRLRRVPTNSPLFETGLWIITHPDLQASRRVRAFIDFMAERLAQDAHLLDGRGARQ